MSVLEATVCGILLQQPQQTKTTSMQEGLEVSMRHYREVCSTAPITHQVFDEARSY